MDTLPALFAHRRPDPGTPFIITPDGTTMTYGDTGAQSARVANALRGLGTKPGDRVAVQIEKSPLAVMLYLACIRSGAEPEMNSRIDAHASALNRASASRRV